MIASRVVQNSGKITISDLKEKGKEVLKTAKQLAKEKEERKRARLASKPIGYEKTSVNL